MILGAEEKWKGGRVEGTPSPPSGCRSCPGTAAVEAVVSASDNH